MRTLLSALLLLGMAGSVSGQEAKPEKWAFYDSIERDINFSMLGCEFSVTFHGSSKAIKDIFPAECAADTLGKAEQKLQKSEQDVRDAKTFLDIANAHSTAKELQTSDGMGAQWDDTLRIDGRTYDCNHGDCEMPDTRWDDAIRDAEEEAATLAKRVKRLQQAARIFRLNKKEGMKWPEPEDPIAIEDALQ